MSGTDVLVFLKALLLAIYDLGQLQALAGLIAADVILAVALSIMTGTFLLGKIADFLRTRIVPYFLAFTAVKLVALAAPEVFPLSYADEVVWLAIIGAEAGRILGHLRDLGLPIPTALTAREPIEYEAEVVEALEGGDVQTE